MPAYNDERVRLSGDPSISALVSALPLVLGTEAGLCAGGDRFAEPAFSVRGEVRPFTGPALAGGGAFATGSGFLLDADADRGTASALPRAGVLGEVFDTASLLGVASALASALAAGVRCLGGEAGFDPMAAFTAVIPGARSFGLAGLALPEHELHKGWSSLVAKRFPTGPLHVPHTKQSSCQGFPMAFKTVPRIFVPQLLQVSP